MATTTTGKSGIHLTGTDSGWPVADQVAEPDYTKDGTGDDSLPVVLSVSDQTVTDDAP